MKITALAAILLTLAASSYAFELQTIKSADIIVPEITLPAPVAAPVVPAEKQYQNLWMSVYSNPSWQEAEASDLSADIDVRVRRSIGTFFDASATVDSQNLWINISKFSNNFSLSGSGLNLSMNEWGGNYNITGTVTGDNNQTTFVNVTLFRGFDSYSFNVSGMGMNMSISRNSISGRYDDAQCSKKSVAAVVALALAAQVDKMPVRKSADDKTGERIWLSISNHPFGGWNNVEATDPFSNMQIGLRKSFNKRYDSHITVDDEMEYGSVDNFFSGTWEYRGNRSSLKVDEWAGAYTLQGDLYVKGRNPEIMKIKLDMRGTFGPGSFSIYETGLRLSVDDHGVNGDVDTAVYPKKLVAVITAIAMAMQQQVPNR